MSKEIFNSTVAILATGVSAFLGGWDMALKVLAFFMVIDYASGLLTGLKNKNLNSEVMFWGGIRKCAILTVVAIAVLFDELVGNTTPIFRTLAIYYYVAREGLSVTENLGKLNVPIPSFFKDVLAQLHHKSGSSEPLYKNEENVGDKNDKSK